VGGHHWSVSEQVRTDSFDRLATNGASTSEQSKSKRTLRQSTSMKVERKAYPLPDPKQFESPAATDDILYPLRSFKQLTDRERAAVVDKEVNKGEKEPAPKPDVGFKQPAPRSNSVELSSLPEEVPSAPASIVSNGGSLRERKASKVVVVYDAEKKFTIAAVDAALREHATREGDAILVVAFMENIMSPMGMKMVADLRQFSGVNENIINQQVTMKKTLIESNLQNTNRTQHCETKKIQWGVKVIPGANPKALVAKEIIDFQATSAVFDKNAMQRNKKYYVENLSCNISRLGKDGRKLETVSLFGQSGVMEKTGSTTTSHCSDSSSDSSMNSDSPSIWSRIRLFGSKRSNSGPLRQSFGSSSASSNLGSPRVVDAAEVLDESFSFDSPKPAPGEAYVYAAAGVARPTALAA